MRKNIILGCLFFTLFITIFLMPKLLSVSDNESISINIDEKNKVDKKQFAMYVENDNGEYVEYTDSNYFPESYSLDIEKSHCLDTNNQVVDETISFSNNQITVTSDKTIFCYLYFNKDSAPGTFIFYIGGSDNPEYVTNATTVTYLSWNDTDIAYYCVTNIEGSSNCEWQSVSGTSITSSYTLTSGDETKILYAYIKDSAGNVSLSVTDTIILDETSPIDNSISINNGATYTTRASVTLKLSSSGVSEMCVSNTTSCSDWETYVTSKNWTLTTGDGEKAVYVWFRDKYGNTSEYVTDTITLDTSVPTSNSVSINSAATYTNSTSVTLTLVSTGASQMCISNTSSCSNWITYVTSKSHTLTSGDGTKTVYVWYRDAAGNTTSYVSDTITLDTTIPTVTASVSSNNTSSPKISITSSEAGTYCVNTTSTATNFSNCTLTGSISANTALTTSALSSSGTYYVHIKDSAGNVGGSNAISITTFAPIYLCTTNTTFGTCLKSAKTTGFNSTMEGGLYRYQGTSVNNYVCFGTSDRDTCLANTDYHLYRVIGINSSNQVKLIKNEQLISDDLGDTGLGWPNSLLFYNLNNHENALEIIFVGNENYVPNTWESKIVTYNWKYGDNASNDITANELYSIENAGSTVSAKIGLMYMHDYYYAYQSGGLNCSKNSSYSTCLSSWLHISNCYSDAPTTYENTMSRVGWDSSSSSYRKWTIAPKGYSYSSMDSSGAVRPVFFLTTSVNYISGKGTSNDPFIIS